MKHKGTKTIETPRLVLRAFRLSDAEAAYKNWMADEKVTAFLTWPAHSDLSITKMAISDWVEQYKNSDYYQWAIVLKDIDEPIGSISVVDINEKCENVTIGYCIGQKWWHQGVTSEAFKAVIDYLFESVEVNRIEAKHDTNNPNSGKVMKKCGLKYEGTLRQAGFNNYGIVDESIYGLLRSEWKR